MIAQSIANYEIIDILGRNNGAGRITYLAQNGDRQVVIKEFQFAKGADWSGFKELEREIIILKGLQHPQIPRYIDNFEHETGFCLVQEYIPAPSLAEVRSRSLEQIQDIGHQLLEILVYLQKLHPPVLHRDIKPENILCNDDDKVFLVDFGLSRLGSAEVAASSIMVGTTGFIPPELFAGREPTKASDLYSLGATLVSLITGTPSTKMDRLLGEDFRFVDAAYDEVDRPYSNWLRKMTAVQVRDRFADAASALEGLDEALNLKLITISSPVASKQHDSELSGISPLIKVSAIFLVQILIANLLSTILTGMSIPAALTQAIHTLQGVGYKQD
jgi:serine/threonine protein kinase